MFSSRKNNSSITKNKDGSFTKRVNGKIVPMTQEDIDEYNKSMKYMHEQLAKAFGKKYDDVDEENDEEDDEDNEDDEDEDDEPEYVTVKCPNCGAPKTLEYDTYEACEYCGTMLLGDD